MKIKQKEMKYEDVLALPSEERLRPKRPSLFFRTLLKLASASDLRSTGFTCKRIGMERLGEQEPCLYLMNHSSYIDLKIASTILYPRPFNIVCTSDGFVGKKGLMRSLGCIPTQKFVTDTGLVRNMLYAFRHLHSSVLMFPEASYTFDGTATPLPESIGKCLKLIGVPVVMIRTFGAFARDPLYNGLRLRKVNVSAEMEYILSPAEIAEKTPQELNEIMQRQFSFDNFRWQQENEVRVTETFRAEGLNRVLYKCPHCGREGCMKGEGETLTCTACGKAYELTDLGYMRAADGGETEFAHIPDWYRWERECVRQELEAGTYRLEIPVEIRMMVDMKAIYHVGEGVLTHTKDGFRLTGCGGKLDYTQKPGASYSLYADYFWYEIGDMICIGGADVLYYCFPKQPGDVVAKTRLAAEELYRMTRARLHRHAEAAHTASASADTASAAASR